MSNKLPTLQIGNNFEPVIIIIASTGFRKNVGFYELQDNLILLNRIYEVRKLEEGKFKNVDSTYTVWNLL